MYDRKLQSHFNDPTRTGVNYKEKQGTTSRVQRQLE